jgi:hypothetical protein
MSAHVAQQFFLCPHCREPGCKPSDFDIAHELHRKEREEAEDMREAWRQWRILTEIKAHARSMRQMKTIQEANDALFAQNLSDEESMRQQQLVVDAHLARVLQEEH